MASLDRFNPWEVFAGELDPDVRRAFRKVVDRLPPESWNGGPQDQFLETGPLQEMRLGWPGFLGSLGAVTIQLTVPEINGSLRAHSNMFRSVHEARMRALVTASYGAALYAGTNTQALRTLVRIELAHRRIPAAYRQPAMETVERTAFMCPVWANEIVSGIEIPLETKERAWKQAERIDVALGISLDTRCPTYEKAAEVTQKQIDAIEVTERLRQQVAFLFDALPPTSYALRGHAESVVAEILGEQAARELELRRHRDVVGPAVDLLASHPRAIPNRITNRGLRQYLLHMSDRLEPSGRVDRERTRERRSSERESGLALSPLRAPARGIPA